MAKTKQIKIGEREFTIRKLTLRQIRDSEEMARASNSASAAHAVSVDIIRTAIKSAGQEPPDVEFFLDLDPEDVTLVLGEVMSFSHLVQKGEAKSP